MNRPADSAADERPGPRYGLLLLSLVGLGVIAAAAPSGCHDCGCDDGETTSADQDRCGGR